MHNRPIECTKQHTQIKLALDVWCIDRKNVKTVLSFYRLTIIACHCYQACGALGREICERLKLINTLSGKIKKWSDILLVDCDKANFPLNVGKYGISVECNQPQSSQIVRCPILKKRIRILLFLQISFRVMAKMNK